MDDDHQEYHFRLRILNIVGNVPPWRSGLRIPTTCGKHKNHYASTASPYPIDGLLERVELPSTPERPVDNLIAFFADRHSMGHPIAFGR